MPRARTTRADTTWYVGPPAGGRSSASSWATSAWSSARMSGSSVGRCSRSLMVISSLVSGGAASAGVAEVDAVLLDQVGVPLLVLLELRHDLVTRDLLRREVVLLVEGLVLLRLERRLHRLGDGVLDVLRGALRHGHEAVLRDLDVEALLLRGGHVGEEVHALGAEDGQRDDLAGLDVLDGLADLEAGGVDLVAEEGGERGGAAVERDRLGRGVVDVEGQRAGELGTGADARGAVGDLLVGVLQVVD